MWALRTFAAAGIVTASLWLGAASASAQTTTTMPPTLPVTGAPEDAAAPDPANLATTGIELIPVVNAGIGMIGSGAALLVGAELRSSRRRRSLWSY